MQQAATPRDDIGATNEEIGATNDEIGVISEEAEATNEVIVATNEEVGATNEEIVTTNKELQRENEELRKELEKLKLEKQELELKHQKEKEDAARRAKSPTSFGRVVNMGLQATGFGKQTEKGQILHCVACKACKGYEANHDTAPKCLSCGCPPEEHRRGYAVVHRAYEMREATAAARRSFSGSIPGRAIHSSIVIDDAMEIEYGDYGIRKKTPERGGWRSSESIGVTMASFNMIEDKIISLGRGKFSQDNYDILINNCNTFAQDLRKWLVGRGINSTCMELQNELANSSFARAAVRSFYTLHRIQEGSLAALAQSPRHAAADGTVARHRGTSFSSFGSFGSSRS